MVQRHWGLGAWALHELPYRVNRYAQPVSGVKCHLPPGCAARVRHFRGKVPRFGAAKG